MVYKVSKGGVRSGNTLRGLNSCRTKRYGLQSCLISRSSLGTKDLKHMIAKNVPENKLLKETLGSTDVILSLNKKRRWQIPATLSHMMSSGSMDSCNSISVLERHKLKRRANCVRYMCNAGSVRHVQPGQKRYFSYSLKTTGGEKSNREKRKIKAEALKKIKAPVESWKNVAGTKIKTVTVFTSDPVVQTDKTKDSDTCPQSDHRIEIFYPCPKTCSLTFNPKYTDVVLSEGKTGDLEVKSNIIPKKQRRRNQRKRHNIDVIEDESIKSDVQQMWLDHYGSLEDEVGDTETESAHISECDLLTFDEGKRHTFYLHDGREAKSALSLLIEQAELTRKLCKDRKDKKHLKKKCAYSETEEKTHIVYDPYVKSRVDAAINVNKEKITTTANIDNPATSDSEFEMDSFQLIMNTSEIAPSELIKNYGNHYSEANCLPRRFILNVTDDIATVLSVNKSSNLVNTAYLSFLIFTYDGPYDEGLDSYKVTFNSYICKNTNSLCQHFPFERCSISDVMNRVLGFLLDMKSDNQLQISTSTAIKEEVRPNFIHDTFKVKIETFKTSDELSRAANCDEIQEDATLDYGSKMYRLSEDIDSDMFCEICYTNVNPTKMDAQAETKTKLCSHLFCNQCWRTYFRMKMNNGSFKMTCPSYNCSSEIGPVTLVSLLHVTEVGRLFQRLCEETVEQQENVTWCPDPACGSAIRISSTSNKSITDVNCACGEHFCFLCMGPAHWPAKCEQADEYMQKLPTLSLPKETAEEAPVPIILQRPKRNKTAPMIIEGRICPACLRFIDKNGGCPNMLCKCGVRFCWTCMRIGYHRECLINTEYLNKHTRRVIVRHTVSKEPIDTPPVKTTPKPEKQRQKASMFQKALQQRIQRSSTKMERQRFDALTMGILKSASRDMALKGEILRICGVSYIPEVQLPAFDMSRKVKEFLLSFLELKRSLHQVVEFTMVLLQNTPDCLDKRRLLKIANDISGFCSFLQSVLDAGGRQKPSEALQHLVEIKEWCRGAVDALLSVSYRIKE